MCFAPVQGLVEVLKKLKAGKETAMTTLVDEAMAVCFRLRVCIPGRVPEGALI